MAERNSEDVTLNTLHADLTGGFTEMRSGLADLKMALVTGFRSLPNRESSEEMIRLLREGNSPVLTRPSKVEATASLPDSQSSPSV